MRNRLRSDGVADDVALELLLALSTDPTESVSDEVLAEVVTKTKAEALHISPRAGRPPRKRWVVPLAVGGAPPDQCVRHEHRLDGVRPANRPGNSARRPGNP
jgi:hypothetical protein